MPNITSTFQPASESAILVFEAKSGLQLPEDYKSFLREHNGGAPDRKTFHVLGMNQDVYLDNLFGLSVTKNLSLETWLAECEGELPKGFLVIGSDPGAGLLLLGCDPPNAGVFYWDYGYRFKGSSDQGNTYPVARSFSEFLEKLR